MNKALTHIAAHYVFTGHELIKNAYVSVDDTGEVYYVSEENQALDERERMIFYTGIIAPGFINAHCHLELSGLNKLTATKKGLTEFINSVAKVRNSKTDNEYSILMQDEIMYNNGIQAVGDVMNESVSLKTKEKSKIRYINFIEVFGLDSTKSEKKMQFARALKQRSEDLGFRSYITPHSFYSLSDNLYRNILDTDSDLFSIHFLESQEEYEYLFSKSGKMYESFCKYFEKLPGLISSPKDLIDEIYGLLSQRKGIILVHNTMHEKSMFESADNLFLCLCPNSNITISDRLPSKELMFNSNHNFVIGTDSIASNSKLCVLSELVLLEEHYDIPLINLLKFATLNGAKALQIDDLGKIAPGTKPGIILIEDIDLKSLKLTKDAKVRRIY